MAGSFLLTKWYFDITPDQETFIGYAAHVHWKKIQIGYSGYLTLIGSALQSYNSFKTMSIPSMDSSAIQWKANQVEALWRSLEQPIDELLLDSPKGSIRWHVLFPKAAGTFTIGGRTFSGHGYAERMDITIPVWNIPIRKLYWGRYLSPDHTIIWIEWQGPVPKLLIYCNGKKYESGTITNSHVVFDRFELELKPGKTLRKGSIGSTIFSGVARIAALFPSSIFSLEENKWTGLGLLREGGSPLDSGRYIHEVVTWH